MGNRQIKIFWLVLLLGLFSLFQNCGGSDANEESQSSASLEFCGEAGFEFLHKNYFVPECGICHDRGGLAFPPFADENIKSSYGWAHTISSDRLWETSIENKFCGPQCNLKPGTELHAALEQWLQCK